MRYLEGKFVLRQEPDSYRTGQIIKATKRAALVQFDQMKSPEPALVMPAELVCLEELMHAEFEFGKMWVFFDSRAQLEGYLHWLNTVPGSQPVVKLVPKKPF